MALSPLAPAAGKVGRLFARDVFPVLFSTGCKAAFGMAFAAILLARFASGIAVDFFQLILLQAIFVTFLSGAGYGRAVGASESEGELQRMLGGYMLFAVLAVAAVALLEALIVPRDTIARFISPERWQIYALIVGGAATSLHGILQGVLVRTRGPARIFYPVSFVSLACALLLFLSQDLGPGGLLAVYVGSQVATLLAFLVVNPAALRLLWQAVRVRKRRTDVGASSEALAFGAINALALILYFLFRELWSERVDSGLAEAAFFGIRISEIVLGVMFVVVANSSLLRHFRYENPISRRLLGMVAGAIILLGLVLLSLVMAGARLQETVPLVLLCLGLQALCEGLRVPASIATLFELQYGMPLRFLLIAIPPYLIAGGLALAMAAALPLFSFYFFQLTFAGLQAGAAIACRAIFEARRPAAGST